MLDFRGVPDHGIGANPRKFTNIGAASHHGSWSNVARTDEVGAGFNAGRSVDDDAFAAGEKTRVFAGDLTADGSHLRLQTAGMLRVEQLPYRAVTWQNREVPVFRPGKGGEEGRSVRHAAPVHAPSKRCLGINVVMAQDARW